MVSANSADRAGLARLLRGRGAAMPITDIPIFAMLRTRMQWHQERQRLLAENVANADTPKFRPRDLSPLKLDSQPVAAGVTLVRTSPAHLGVSAASGSQFQLDRHGEFQVRPTGNAVSLEDEMLKVASNTM